MKRLIYLVYAFRAPVDKWPVRNFMISGWMFLSAIKWTAVGRILFNVRFLPLWSIPAISRAATKVVLKKFLPTQRRWLNLQIETYLKQIILILGKNLLFNRNYLFFELFVIFAIKIEKEFHNLTVTYQISLNSLVFPENLMLEYLSPW